MNDAFLLTVTYVVLETYDTLTQSITDVILCCCCFERKNKHEILYSAIVSFRHSSTVVGLP